MTDPTPARVVPEMSYEQLINFELICARHYLAMESSSNPLNLQLAEVFYHSARRKRMEFEGRW